MSNYTTYQDFEYNKLNCRACPVGCYYNHVVPSCGNKKNPKIVICGEAPGEKELIKNMPFCGKCGIFLRDTINYLGFNSKNTLITNTIPCRPIDNKFSSAREEDIINCTEKWLLPEIKLTNPDYVVLIGAQSLKYVTGLSGISKYRGQLLTVPSWPRDGVTFMATYHPAYIQRVFYMLTPLIKSEDRPEVLFFNDLKKIANLAGLKPLGKKWVLEHFNVLDVNFISLWEQYEK